MTCNGIRGNSITHKNSNHKDTVIVEWTHENLNETIFFKAVVVFEYRRAQILEMTFNEQTDILIQII